MKREQWAFSRSLEARYERDIQRVIGKILPDLIPVMGMSIKQLSTDQFLEMYAAQAARRMVTGLLANQARTWRAAAMEGMKGRELYQALQQEMGGSVGAAARQLVYRNAELIKSVPVDVGQWITDFVQREQAKGQRFESMMAEIQARAPEIARSRIRLIARTETSKAGTALTRARCDDLGLGAYVWRTSSDSRVRDSHRKMDGVICFWNDPPAPEALVGIKSGLGHYSCGDAPNCFTGDTVVDLSNGCENIWRMAYSGDMVNLQFKSYSLSVTPNHPILTQRGWVAAGLINDSDYCVQVSDQTAHRSKRHKDQVLPTFDDLFCAFSFESEARSGFEFNFHNHVPEGDVEAIALKHLLPGDGVSSKFQSICNFALSRSNRRIGDVLIVGSDGHIFESDSTRWGDVSAALIGGHASHTKKIGLASVASVDSVAIENLVNGPSISAMLTRESKFTDSGVILRNDDSLRRVCEFSNRRRDARRNYDPSSPEMLAEIVRSQPDNQTSAFQGRSGLYEFCRVINKRIRNFTGHVYTLQSDNGWYGVTPDSIISKNCRCYPEPVLRLGQITFPAKVYRGGSITRMSQSAFRRIAGTGVAV